MGDTTMIDFSRSEAPKASGILCPRCGTCTHPSMLDHGHKSSFEVFLDDVNAGMKRSIEAKMAYSAVKVLFIRWEKDTLIAEGKDNGVQGEIDALQKVFEQDYNFSTETWLIPHEDSDEELRDKIHMFERSNRDPSTLLIVYYGGHGILDAHHKSVWAEGTSVNAPIIEWFSIQHQLEKSRSDVVLILDCCFAGSADAASTNGNITVLSACVRENTTIRPEYWSFTSRLVEVLQKWKANSFTITQLHAELINSKTPTGYKSLFSSPQHYMKDETKSSIRIARLPSLGTPSLVADGSSSEESLPILPSVNEPRVLLSVFVDSSAREDPHAWIEWLQSHMPDYITGVQLEGLFGSHSTLGLFSLPVRAWDLIQDDAAYHFIGFTTTRNTLIDFQRDEKLIARREDIARRKQYISSPSDVDLSLMNKTKKLKAEPAPKASIYELPPYPSLTSKMLKPMSDQTSTLGSANSLRIKGKQLITQGKLAEAEEMYLRVLKEREKALGPDDIDTLATVNSLGSLYYRQGKLDKAEVMLVRALRGREKTVGSDNTDTLITMKNLGSLYCEQGKLGEAEEMLVRALKGFEKAAGPDNIYTLAAVNNLCGLYYKQGRLVDAEEMLVRALKGFEKVAGPDNIDTLATVNNLGNLYYKQGKLAKAEEMFIQALKGAEKAVGLKHNSTSNIACNLARLYGRQKRYEESRALFQQAESGYRAVLGPEHPKTMKTLNCIEETNKLQEAQESQ